MNLSEYAQKHASELAPLLSPRWNRYLEHYHRKKPLFPSDKQIAGMLLDEALEVFYGGAAGGGKTDWLMGCGVQYLDCPGYSGILFRRTFKQLYGSDGLIERSKEWLSGTGCEWHEQKLYWSSPEGGRLEFGAMESDDDKWNYDGKRYDFAGFDELTHFLLSQYEYIFSRVRRAAGSQIPPRVRAASNPGKVGHAWVKKRFITEGRAQGRPFIPATLDDNPGIDKESYERSLAELSLIDRKRIRDGDWDIGAGGAVFDRSWFKIVPMMPRDAIQRVRYWDLASSIAPKAKRTAGIRMSLVQKHLGMIDGHAILDKRYFVENAVVGKWRPGERDQVIVDCAKMDGRNVHVYIEQEPGSGGDAQCQYLIAKLAGYPAAKHPPRGGKEVRAAPFASQAEQGNVYIVEGPWNEEYLDELQVFPEGELKDQVDASDGAFSKLTRGPVRMSRV